MKNDYELLIVASLFAVIGLIFTFRLPPFMSFDEFRKVARLLCHPHKLVFQEVSSGWALKGYQRNSSMIRKVRANILGIALKAVSHKFTERFGE